MTIHYGFDNFDSTLRTVVTIGSFDGVHAGHGVLLSRLSSMARRLSAESVVVTFNPHPRIAMHRDEGLKLLTTIEERAILLERCGIDRVVVAHFDERFRCQPYESFVRYSLVGSLGMVGMVVGYNHRFGAGSTGNYETLLPLGSELGFDIERVEQYTDTGDKVSSTVVRRVLEHGDMKRAAEIMGHPYIIVGEANCGTVEIEDPYKLIPTDGDYNALVNGVFEMLRVDGGRVLLSHAYSGRVVIEFNNKI